MKQRGFVTLLMFSSNHGEVSIYLDFSRKPAVYTRQFFLEELLSVLWVYRIPNIFSLSKPRMDLLDLQ